MARVEAGRVLVRMVDGEPLRPVLTSAVLVLLALVLVAVIFLALRG